jgi:hypothetical protein
MNSIDRHEALRMTHEISTYKQTAFLSQYLQFYIVEVLFNKGNGMKSYITVRKYTLVMTNKFVYYEP